MQPRYLIPFPTKFKDFEPEYIERLALEYGATYCAQGSPSNDETSLYNNESTETRELYKLAMTVDGLVCEYYTAEFLPYLFKPTEDGRALALKIGALAPGTLTVTEGSESNMILPLVQVFSITLPYSIESLYVESRTNITFNNVMGWSGVAFPGSERVTLEGNFSDFFRVFTPPRAELTAFTILAPNVMLRMLAEAGNYDFEFSGNKIYFYRTFGIMQPGTIPLNKVEYTELLKFGVASAKGMARAARPTRQPNDSSISPMWKLFGITKKAALGGTIVIGGIFIILGLSMVSPLFWPFLPVIIIIIIIRYRLLLARRARLVRDWQSGSAADIYAGGT